MPVHINSPGLLSTIQDLGRYHFAHIGISAGGAADQLACRIANRILGNQENAPVLEMTLAGATMEFDERAVITLTGAPCEASIGTRPVAPTIAIEVSPGETLSCGPIQRGCRAYLAVRGGFEIPTAMGSASTHLGGGFGGLQGRKLQAGDILSIGKDRGTLLRSADRDRLDSLYTPGPIHITRGVQYEWFGPRGFETLLTGRYSISDRSNRAGLRLDGPAVEQECRSQLLTEGVSVGAIQVPEDGCPIILFVDQQTTGGYPKIANIIAADLHRVAQLRPHQEVAFEEVAIPQAIARLCEQEKYLTSIFTC